ncbi:BspA family leucine-rich repeat surface protein [Campylobacter sp. US12a]|uniref:BspA family leucine-rich repeat surface protein n=1 Tax=Campylobacter sp. US12a TaxID=2498116 RepID=UPI00106822E7|nr:BspA family leucine-rich repeat surface protein [Campylobacter sp. US12a]TEY04119.1 BspA family leucine-rich repeat surface protein [Campylobacter sp. US12a]
MPKFTPNTKEQLQALVEDESIYLGDIDTSKITNMSELFLYSTRKDFSGIEKWDVSSVEDMSHMFYGCIYFNQSLGDWDVSNVKDMACMFKGCSTFNQDISSWDTSNVKDMSHMFYGCHSFNQDLSSWNISKVEYTYNMFENCPIDNSNMPNNLRWQGRDKIFKKRDVLIENNNKSVKSFGHLLREVYEQHFYFILTIIFILGFFININSIDILKIRQYDFAFIVIPMFISVAIEFRFIIEKLNRGLFLLGFLSCIIDAISQGNEIFRLIGISLLTINIIKIIMTNKHKIFP